MIEFEKRAELGRVDFSKLEHETLHFHDTNTVVALALLIVSCILYGVVTNTLLADFVTLYVALQ